MYSVLLTEAELELLLDIVEASGLLVAELAGSREFFSSDDPQVVSAVYSVLANHRTVWSALRNARQEVVV